MKSRKFLRFLHCRCPTPQWLTQVKKWQALYFSASCYRLVSSSVAAILSSAVPISVARVHSRWDTIFWGCAVLQQPRKLQPVSLRTRNLRHFVFVYSGPSNWLIGTFIVHRVPLACFKPMFVVIWDNCLYHGLGCTCDAIPASVSCFSECPLPLRYS